MKANLTTLTSIFMLFVAIKHRKSFEMNKSLSEILQFYKCMEN